MLALMVSFCLMIADYHYRYLDLLRKSVSLIVAPLQYSVDYPVRVIGWAQSLVASKKALVDENMQLRYQQTMLESQLQRLILIRNENAQLKELLNTADRAKTKTMAAQILAVETNRSRQLLVLNKGDNDGVFEGQPVLDAKGIMGQIVDVGKLSSTVLLISDSKSGVPVLNNRTGERAILVGNNSMSHLSLINMPKTSSIEIGDMLVTSGLGRKYPEGYPVGIVELIKHIPGDEFVTVDVRPVARLNRNRLALLIWPDQTHAQLTEEIQKRLAKVEGLHEHT